MDRADAIAPRSDAEALLLRFFTTLMARDMRGFADIWHEDAILHIVYRPNDLGVHFPEALHGKQTIVEQFTINVKNRRDHVFWIQHIYATTDPDCVIIEANARSIVGETNGVYENTYIYVFRIRDGLIIDMREYANPINVAKSLGAVFN